MVKIIIIFTISLSVIKKYCLFSIHFHLDGELVFRDPSGGLSIIVIESYTVKVLMTNSTFVSIHKI